MNKIAYLLVGVPGCGKSSFAENLLKKDTSLVYLSSDTYIDKYAADRNLKYEDVYRKISNDAQKWMNIQIAQAINSNKNLIWDQTNVVANARMKRVSRLKSSKYDVIGIVFELSLEELMLRQKKRIEQNGKKIAPSILKNMSDSYTRPSYSEGFSEIYLVNDKSELNLLPINNIKNKI